MSAHFTAIASDVPTPQPSDTPPRPPHQIPVEEPEDDDFDPTIDPTIRDPRPPSEDAPIRLPPGAIASPLDPVERTMP